jgi:transposase-like protein
MSEVIDVCPECNDSALRVRPGGIRSQSKHRYLCERCGAEFDTPRRRERYVPNTQHGLAKRLADADPDAVGGEH